MSCILVVVSVLVVVFLLYLLAIMPRMIGRPDRTGFLNRLYAHRGLHDNKGDAPENSLRAFQKAVDAGYGIEMDIQLTKDDIPVVIHDFDLKRICSAEGKVRDYTYEELQQFVLYGTDQKIPKFEDVLKLVDGKVPLIVEFKIEGNDLSLCPIADEILRGYEGLYCMESFHPLCVKWYRDNHKEIMRGQLSCNHLKGKDKKKVLDFALQFLLFNCLTKPDFIAYDHHAYKNLSRRLCSSLFGALPVAWTIRSQEELDVRQKDFALFIFDSFIPASAEVKDPEKNGIEN